MERQEFVQELLISAEEVIIVVVVVFSLCSPLCPPTKGRDIVSKELELKGMKKSDVCFFPLRFPHPTTIQERRLALEPLAKKDVAPTTAEIT